MKKTILFDGDCHFCDKSVQFVLKRDPKAHFVFASLQSGVGKELRETYHINKDVDSIILIEDNRYFIQSTAALRICRSLKGLWKLFYILILIPRPIRDLVYVFIARNRYKWFGKRESCKIPTVEERKRFL